MAAVATARSVSVPSSWARHLRGHHLGHLGDLLGRDAVVALEALAHAGEGALAQKLAQAPVHRLGDQQPGGVGADVDTGTDHGRRSYLPAPAAQPATSSR